MLFHRSCLAFSALTILHIAPANAFMIPAGCAVPSAGTPGHVFYIDPVNGNDANNGSQTKPWQTIHTTGMNGGDAELLMSGNYGDVKLNKAINAEFVTIQPAPGQTPVLTSLQINGSVKWIIQDLKFRALASDYDPFIAVSGNSFTGSGHDIIIDSNNISSQDNVSAWKQSDWVAKARWQAISVDGGDATSSRMKCVTVTNNVIKNLRLGITAFADNMVVSGNSLDNFGDDAIDFAANNLVISKNKITNSLDIGDGNHGDAIQGQIGSGNPGTTVFNNIVIDGNTVEAKTKVNLKFAGDLQGITAFDMDWSNLQIINNIIVTNNYHGLSFYSLHNGLIANNAVMGTSTAYPTWLGVFDTSHQGKPSNNVVVRNNITTSLYIDTPASSVTADHNLIVSKITWMVKGAYQYLSAAGVYGNHNQIDPTALSVFQNFDIPNATYNLRLKADSIAKGAGVLPAPNKATGVARKVPVDLGPY